MLSNLQKRKSASGFTIIEVMIVLAIAALILLVVLLAVPALQRNSRNTTMKNDVSSVAGGINTFMSDNNGTQAQYIGGSGSAGWVDTATTATANREQIKVQGGTTLATVTTAPSSVAAGTIDAQFGNTCPTTLGGTNTASGRAFSLFYSIETSSGLKLQCTDS